MEIPKSKFLSLVNLVNYIPRGISMKKITVFVLSVLLIALMSVGVSASEFLSSLQEVGIDNVNGIDLMGELEWDVVRDGSEDIAVDQFGNVYGISGPWNDRELFKYDGSGNLIWSSPANNGSRRITLDDNGFSYTTGGSWGVWMTAKYDPDGDKLWEAAFSMASSPATEGQYVIVDTSGNVYVAGSAGYPGDGSSDLTVIKYDAIGTELWYYRFHEAGLDVRGAKGFDLDNDGNIYVTAYEAHNHGIVMKLDPDGNRLWYKHLPGTTHLSDPNDLIIDSEANVYVASYTRYDGMYVFKYDAQGNFLWQAYHAETLPSELALGTDGSLYVVGSLWQDWQVLSCRILKYDSDGNELWMREHDVSRTNQGMHIVLDDMNNAYIAGVHLFANVGFYQESRGTGIVKYDGEGVKLWEQYYDGNFGSLVSHFPTELALGPDDSLFISTSRGYIAKFAQVPDVDSDQDGVSDIYEQGYGTDPNDANSYPVALRINALGHIGIDVWTPNYPGQGAYVNVRQKPRIGWATTTFTDQAGNPVIVRNLPGRELSSEFLAGYESVVVVPKAASISSITIGASKTMWVKEKMMEFSDSITIDLNQASKYPAQNNVDFVFGIQVSIY